MPRKIIQLAVALLALPALLVAYVVLRHVIFWVPTEEISFASGDITLAGTLVKPASSGTFPAVVLLHGSGPETRSDPPLRAVINVLARNGYAVLMYDKRGVGESGGEFGSAQYPDFVADAIAAVEYVTARQDIDEHLVGIYAVSEGAWFAPEVAARTGQVDFIFNKAGSPLPVKDSWLWEIGNEFTTDGFSAEDARTLVDLARLRWEYYEDSAADPSLASGARRDAVNAEITHVIEQVPGAGNVIRSELEPYDQERDAGFASSSSYNPQPFVESIDIPMYYAFAENDVNIPTAQSVALLDALIQSGKRIDYTVFPDIGHSLATWKGALQFGYVPGFLDILDEWTSARLDEHRQEPAS